MEMKFLILASALILGAIFPTSLAGTPGRCKVKWLFGAPCSDVAENLITQIEAWQYMYELKSSSHYLIEATYTSPTTTTVNKLQFFMDQSQLCKVIGEATLEDSEDPTDNSSNYCSMQNLIQGSGLVNDREYYQFTNKWMCPGLKTVMCNFF